MKTMAEQLTEEREAFRNIMAEYFYLIGDDEAYQDILTKSHEKLIHYAYLFAIKHFETCIQNYKGEK